MWWDYLGREGPWGVGFLPRDEGLGISLLLVGYLDGGKEGVIMAARVAHFC